MNAVSILLASITAAAPPSLKMDARFAPIAFQGELSDLIHALQAPAKDASRVGAGKGEKPGAPRKKNPAMPQVVLITALLPSLPAPPPASFGLPAPGIEPGSAGRASETESAPPNPIDTPLPQAAPAAADSKSNPKVDLALALRLADLTPGREGKPVELAQQPAPARAPELPVALPVPPPRIPEATMPRPAIAFQPSPRQVAAAPPIYTITAADAAATPPDPHADDSGASKREPPQPLPQPPDLNPPSKLARRRRLRYRHLVPPLRLRYRRHRWRSPQLR